MRTDRQPPLFPTETFFKKELEAKPPLFVLLIDSTPSYDAPLIYEQCDLMLKGQRHEISFPERPSTPANLLELPNLERLKVFVRTHQRMIEATGTKKTQPCFNVIFETPLSCIAWTLFQKEINGPSKQDKVLIETSKNLLYTIGKNLDTVPSFHLVRLVSYERLHESLNHFSNKDLATIKKRVEIFNGCLETAAKITSHCLTGVRQVITD